MMEFDDIKNVWQHQPEQKLPASDTVLEKIKMQKQKIAQTLLTTVIRLVVAIGVLVLVLISVKFDSPLTYTGIAVMLLCIAIYGYINYVHYKTVIADYSTMPPSSFLITMQKHYQRRIGFLYTGRLLYTLALTLGLLLYLIEPLSHLTAFWKIFIIAATILWIIFAYAVLGKRVLTREQQHYAEMIKQLKQLSSGYADGDS